MLISYVFSLSLKIQTQTTMVLVFDLIGIVFSSKLASKLKAMTIGIKQSSFNTVELNVFTPTWDQSFNGPTCM